MWRIIERIKPNTWVGRKLMAVAVVTGVAVGAFCWGKREAHSQGAQPAGPSHAPFATPAGGDYARREVAKIFDTLSITREDLGEYLIARFGTPERIEFLVNHKIIEHVCRAKNIHISAEEIHLRFKEDLKNFNVSEEVFVQKILKPRNKSIYEYREDVIRPQLALAKLCKGRVNVTKEDIQKAFEAKYGEKVDCRIIVLSKEFAPRWNEIWQNANKGEKEFNEEARKQPTEYAAKGGAVDPIHRHFPDARIEKTAFELKDGQVSTIIGLPDGNAMILRCVRRIPADLTKTVEQERLQLHGEVFELKLAQEVRACFEQLRKDAKPTILVK
jgi:hypothetical protein